MPTKVNSTPKRVPPRLLDVVRITDLPAGMRRITLTGATLQGFPQDKNGAHIKVFLPRDNQQIPELPKLGENGPIWPPSDRRPITRTYSVRHYCAINNELDVDFVLHGHNSPAASWAGRVQLGDKVGIAGPGGPDPLLAPARNYFIIGDLTALPAISALLENLPSNAAGHALICGIDHAINIQHDTQIHTHWYKYQRDLIQALTTMINTIDIVGSNKTADTNEIVDTVDLDLPSVSGFVAGENSLVLSARDLLREKYQLNKKLLYAIPYWRRGQDEETYHQERHSIMDQVY